jgi:uncharacterized membrane protein
MRISSWLLFLRERFSTWLPLIYVGYALPIVVAFVLINPPFLAPDEVRHFYRTVQISEGHLYASRSPDPSATFNNTSGGFISASAIYLATRPVFIGPALYPGDIFDPAAAEKEHLFSLPWDDKVQFIAFANIAPYPFTSYLPGAAGLTIGRKTGLSVLQSFYIARLFNAFICVTLSALAIHWVSRGKVILACLLSLPTTLYLFSSLSQDALLISYTALAVGLLNRYLDAPADRRKLWGLGMALALLALVVAGRLPYLPFILIAAQMAYFGAKTRRSALVGGVVAVLLVAIYMLSVRYLGIATLVDGHPERQAALMVQHPIQMLSLMLSTIQSTLLFSMRQFIATFGWLTCELPDPFYPLIEFMLFLVFLGDFKPGDLKLPFWSRIATIILSGSVVVLILSSLFILWNDARNFDISGEQGRYYIPIAIILTMIAGNREAPWMERFPLQMVRLGVGILTLIILVIAGYAGCLACLARFYY